MDKQPRHHLRYEEEYALNGWLMANRERIEALTKDQQLMLANQELSFPVTDAQLVKRRRKLGITCAIHRTPMPKPGNGEDKQVSLDDILRSLDGMGHALAVLVKYQAQIFDQLGVQYGDDLAGLVKRIEMHEERLNG